MWIMERYNRYYYSIQEKAKNERVITFLEM